MVDLRLGPALDTLPPCAGKAGPFDLVFLDADKPNNRQLPGVSPLPLTRRDGPRRRQRSAGGMVADSASDDVNAEGVPLHRSPLEGATCQRNGTPDGWHQGL